MSDAETTGYADVASWELSDSLWARIEPLLPKVKSPYRGRGKNRKHIGGRPMADRRKVLSGILYILRTGCQWNALPQATYGSGRRRTAISRNGRAGVFRRMWQAGLTEYDELKGIAWKWQAADGTMTKAPLGLVVSGANTPDGPLLEATLTSGPVERPDPSETPQHLCLDKAYSDAPSANVAAAHGYVLHVPDKANAKKNARASRGGARPGTGSSKSRTAG
jgi:putative transposase